MVIANDLLSPILNANYRTWSIYAQLVPPTNKHDDFLYFFDENPHY